MAIHPKNKSQPNNIQYHLYFYIIKSSQTPPLETFICIFFIDLEHLLIFNRFVIITAALGIVAIFFDSYTAWYDHLIGFGVAGGAFLLIYLGAILILKKEHLMAILEN